MLRKIIETIATEAKVDTYTISELPGELASISIVKMKCGEITEKSLFFNGDDGIYAVTQLIPSDAVPHADKSMYVDGKMFFIGGFFVVASRMDSGQDYVDSFNNIKNELYVLDKRCIYNLKTTLDIMNESASLSQYNDKLNEFASTMSHAIASITLKERTSYQLHDYNGNQCVSVICSNRTDATEIGITFIMHNDGINMHANILDSANESGVLTSSMPHKISDMVPMLKTRLKRNA